MRILYIIGNGFDIAQGLSTSYKDFEAYYKKIPTDNEYIKRFKQDINPELNLWSDLEIALGKYTEKISDPRIFEEVYFDVQEKLEEYLKQQEQTLQYTEQYAARCLDNALHPERYLEPADMSLFQSYMKPEQSLGGDFIDVISFNYTSSFERILGFDSQKSNMHIPQSPLGDVVHVHGRLDGVNPIIFGVDSMEQIVNKSYEHNTIENVLIKPRANNAIRSNNPIQCEQLIQRADVIIMFGVSIGASDSTWWKMIAEEILKRHDLMLIVHKFTGKKHDYRRKTQWMPKLTGNVKYIFNKRAFGKNGSSLANRSVFDLMQRNVVVAIDKPVFSREVMDDRPSNELIQSK